ncbi:hypothetical protein BD410DRAFT_842552 [Rickenella mellea]|uniref:Uncharacterized protein n=1 Tax=Rickenella mellea TaxID=50990 RepID=A0A4Y7PVB6_9AGAM|nr:hypothetical protein BD410DRAFT_842552 [Rickenella mellea]
MPITKLANLAISDLGGDQSLSDTGSATSLRTKDKDSVGATSVKDKSAERMKENVQMKEKGQKSQLRHRRPGPMSIRSLRSLPSKSAYQSGLWTLLVRAYLRLKAVVHYALVGRNGEGKPINRDPPVLLSAFSATSLSPTASTPTSKPHCSNELITTDARKSTTKEPPKNPYLPRHHFPLLSGAGGVEAKMEMLSVEGFVDELQDRTYRYNNGEWKRKTKSSSRQ